MCYPLCFNFVSSAVVFAQILFLFLFGCERAVESATIPGDQELTIVKRYTEADCYVSCSPNRAIVLLGKQAGFFYCICMPPGERAKRYTPADCYASCSPNDALVIPGKQTGEFYCVCMPPGEKAPRFQEPTDKRQLTGFLTGSDGSASGTILG